MNKTEYPFSDIDIKQMEVSISYYNLEDPIWIRGFAFYNKQFPEGSEERLKMMSRPNYRKVLDYVRFKSMQS